MYSGERETDGSMTFSAHSDGRFAYCFSNKMSTVTPKTVAFDVFVGSKPRSGPETDPETAGKWDLFLFIIQLSCDVFFLFSFQINE